MKIPCFVSWSTITKIASQPEEVGRVLMKSMEIESKGHSGTKNCFSKP